MRINRRRIEFGAYHQLRYDPRVVSSPPVIAGTPVCPACERERPPTAVECPFCGVVYARYRPRLPSAALTPVPEPPAPESKRRLYLTLAQTERFLVCAAQSLEAGLSPTQFVEGPALGAFPPRLREHLRAHLANGGTLSRALIEIAVINPAGAALVEAGETQGKLGGALAALAKRYEAARQARRRTLILLAYPTVLFVLSNLILPLPTAVTEGVGAYLWSAVPPVIGVAVLYGAALVVLPRMPARTWVPLRRVFAHVPPVSTIYFHRATATFAETLGAGVSAGLPITLAVRLATDAADHPTLTPRTDAVVAGIEGGATLSDALASIGFFAAQDLALIGHGELVGKLDEVLPRVYAEHAQRARALTTAVIIGVSTVVLAVVVVSVALAIIRGFSGYFGTMNDSVDVLFRDL